MKETIRVTFQREGDLMEILLDVEWDGDKYEVEGKTYEREEFFELLENTFQGILEVKK